MRTFFFFFFFSLVKTTGICFGSTKMGIFYREKAFHAGKKIWKNYFALSEKYACYAPAYGAKRQFRDGCVENLRIPFPCVFPFVLNLRKGQTRIVCGPDLAHRIKNVKISIIWFILVSKPSVECKRVASVFWWFLGEALFCLQ